MTGGSSTITPYLSTMVFVLVVFGIALVTWALRLWVESDPDPFVLNLTFFAFAGQCIRTSEFYYHDNKSGWLLVLFLIALFLVLLQSRVLLKHRHKTLDRYRSQLELHKQDNCSPWEIEYWAALLLKVTGTDFSPGSYRRLRWLPVLTEIFATEPRKRRRIEAVQMLPDSHFKKRPTVSSGLNDESLEVPPPERIVWWKLYCWICVASWVIFIWAIRWSEKT